MGSDQGDGGPPGKEGPSFDPRTWSPRAAAPPPADEAQAAAPAPNVETSFDPKTWAAGLPQPPDRRPTPQPSRRALVVGLGVGGAAVLGLGGVAAWQTLRHRPIIAPAPHRAGAPGASAPPKSRPGSSVTLAVGSLLMLQQQLPDYQVPSDEAAQAAAVLSRAFGGGEGRLLVVVQFAPPGAGSLGRIVWLEARRSDGVGVRLDRVGAAFQASALAVTVTTRLCGTPWGEMNEQSFYSSATSLMDDGLIAQFTQAMAFDFNFAHDLWPGSQFRAVFEKDVDDSGAVVGRTRLVMAFLSVDAFHDVYRNVDEPPKSKKFYLFDPAGDGHPAWFSDAGVGAVRDLMRTPVDGARVSSGFGYREHPILDRIIFHKGVDLACPVGTPVYAAADGVVIRATDPPHSGGYGNFLNIRHSEHMVTCYAHLSRFGDGIVVGTKVSQGQTVAFSGNTGNSTGPHLHYEIRWDDQPVDPLSFKTNTTRTLDGDQLVRFRIRRAQIDAVGEGCA